MSADPRPVLLVTNHAPAYRAGAFSALHAREDLRVALIGGALRHGGAGACAWRFPVLRCSQRHVARLAGSGAFRAVIAGLSGRLAPAAAYAGARAAGVPFVLWATLWAHPRSPAHVISYGPVRHLYRHADAVVTYGPHVSAYVCAKGSRGPVVEAPQAVDAAFWSHPAPPDRRAGFQVLFPARLEREKGVQVLLAAWRRARPSLGEAALVAAGDGPLQPLAQSSGALAPGPLAPDALRSLYAGSDVVVLPSIPTPTFREPWGLVVNEAMHAGVPVIASNAVGAVAGGLLRHGVSGLVVPAGSAGALAGALLRLHRDPALRERLAAGGRRAVAGYTQAAWAQGVSRALAAVGASRPVVA